MNGNSYNANLIKKWTSFMADKQKAEITAQGLTNNCQKEKQRLENEFKETQEKLLASQVKLDRLNAQHEELSEKYSSGKSLEDNQRLYLELKSATDQERKDNNNTIKLLQRSCKRIRMNLN
ncbi:unnamed protein product [Rhizophagus irregularis]|nr:unnamed protein product [Rhizophagus irregularis]